DDIVHRRDAANQPREDSTHESGDSRTDRTDNLVVVGHAYSLEERTRGGLGPVALVARTDRDNDHRLRPGVSVLVVSATEPQECEFPEVGGPLREIHTEVVILDGLRLKGRLRRELEVVEPGRPGRRLSRLGEEGFDLRITKLAVVSDTL